jgi:hypothetical protein
MPWKKKETGEPTRFDIFRDEGHTVITCGIDGCRVKRSGPFAKAMEKMAAHRAERHPGWTKPRYRLRGKKRIRIN